MANIEFNAGHPDFTPRTLKMLRGSDAEVQRRVEVLINEATSTRTIARATSDMILETRQDLTMAKADQAFTFSQAQDMGVAPDPDRVEDDAAAVERANRAHQDAVAAAERANAASGAARDVLNAVIRLLNHLAVEGGAA